MKARVVMVKPSTMSDDQAKAVVQVVAEVTQERFNQHEKWGEQNHPNFPRLDSFAAEEQKTMADDARAECQDAFKNGAGSYYHILNEELAEAYAEANNPEALRAELIQVAAVAVAWVEKIDRDARRTGGTN